MSGGYPQINASARTCRSYELHWTASNENEFHCLQ